MSDRGFGWDHHTLARVLSERLPFSFAHCCSLLIHCLLLLEYFQDYVWRQELSANVLVMLCCMVLCPIVCIVLLAWSPIEPKLLLAFSVAEPMESHIHCFRSFWLNLFVDNSFCHCIVRLHWSWRLLVAHFLQDDSNVHCLSCHYDN